MTIIFVITTGICAVGWLLQRLSTAALLWYLDTNNIPFPSDSEMKEGCEWAMRHMVKDLFCWRNKH